MPSAKPKPRPGVDTCSVLIPHNSPRSEGGGPAQHLFLCSGAAAFTSAGRSKESHLVAASSGTFISFFSRGAISQMTCAFSFVLQITDKIVQSRYFQFDGKSVPPQKTFHKNNKFIVIFFCRRHWNLACRVFREVLCQMQIAAPLGTRLARRPGNRRWHSGCWVTSSIIMQVFACDFWGISMFSAIGAVVSGYLCQCWCKCSGRREEVEIHVQIRAYQSWFSFVHKRVVCTQKQQSEMEIWSETAMKNIYLSRVCPCVNVTWYFLLTFPCSHSTGPGWLSGSIHLLRDFTYLASMFAGRLHHKLTSSTE